MATPNAAVPFFIDNPMLRATAVQGQHVPRYASSSYLLQEQRRLKAVADQARRERAAAAQERRRQLDRINRAQEHERRAQAETERASRHVAREDERYLRLLAEQRQ